MSSSPSSAAPRAALYARTSTAEQEPDNQLFALRDYAARRGWCVVLEYVDDGVSGAAADRPALAALARDARRGRFDVVVCWRLDRLGRSLRRLVMLIDELTAYSVSFASVDDAVDLSTAGGRFMAHVLGALAEYERSMIAERVRLGLQHARRKGKRLGRPPVPHFTAEQLAAVADLSISEAARALGSSRTAVWRRRRLAQC